MNLTLCMAWLVIAAGATAAKPAETEAELANKKVQAVIDDVEKACLDRTVYMIGRQKAERLAELVRKNKPRLVVECGAAIGYSGLWIARELKAAGRGKLVTIEIDPQRAKEAEANFRRAGLEKYVTIKVGDARKVVDQIDGPIDFLFVDCGYSNYHPILVKLQEKLRKGAVVVADNVGIGAGGMDDYLNLVRSKYRSKTEWFDLKLPWAKRDAMEVTLILPPEAVEQ
jgi:caffeoyl-CoA O-methyltransferase